ncbi:MAG: DUF1080 domain-containing protein [Verrucomicrobiota bacterium]
MTCPAAHNRLRYLRMLAAAAIFAGGFTVLAQTTEPAKPTAAAAAPAPEAKPAPAKDSPGVLSNLVRTVKEAVGLGDDSDTNRVVRLFDGTGLDNFYTWIEGNGVFVDPRKVFSVEDGVLKITGERNGYLATKQQFSDYRLVFEYKWGKAIWSEKGTRNSGVFVHAVGEDKEWMRSIECQIASGLTGSAVVHGGSRLSADGEMHSKPYSTLNRKTDKEVEFAPGKWNKMEIVCEGYRVKIIVNGQVTFDGSAAYPNHGKIFFQSNGAEIFFRKIELYPLNPPPIPANTSTDKPEGR